MTEEKRGVSNGPANTSEMAPQEDGTKVPLTNDECAEVKFTSPNNPPNGDAKVDLGTASEFSGLTKEDLMKYADDPFWVRMRWFLFILFWAGWVAMLVLAIVIIIHAPRCAPKETLEWVQESAMIQYDLKHPVDTDNSGDESPEDLIKMAKDLGVTTVYLEDLISPEDFSEINAMYQKGRVTKVLEAAREAGLHVVTDFVPTTVPDTNNWYMNDTLKTTFFKPGSPELDFTSQDLLNALADILRGTWHGIGVQGYLMASVADPMKEKEMRNASSFLNKTLEDIDGLVVYGEEETKQLLSISFDPTEYKNFLQNQVDEWAYYKYNPKEAESTSRISRDTVQLVTLSLFLVPGTPILDGFDKTYFDENAAFIKSLSEFRGKESVQVGNMTFANTTDDDVIAFARVMKGTPGYAVAVNMNPAAVMVNFTDISGVPKDGDNQLKLTNATLLQNDLGASKMDSVALEPNEGIVVQFVPSF
ncbi:hypothetical protein Pmani_015992 [Petrolisthes manimaculis]|uniref:Solute carrier family 3 member 2 N-terminal domain-containing protein n=1 Tax=Petrolisthes manimaculis TaxID=1843537 RepID=A0AAE1UBG5_9EUCA|nr:hypothetical protein Pmani_015992 [Petrolisthes manimaculis]